MFVKESSYILSKATVSAQSRPAIEVLLATRLTATKHALEDIGFPVKGHCTLIAQAVTEHATSTIGFFLYASVT